MKSNKRRRSTQPHTAALALAGHAPHSPPNQHFTPSASATPTWRRILYEQQPYPDNHTPVDWLSAMSSYSSKPAQSEYLPYRAVVWLTVILASRATILTLFVTAFYAINQHAVSTSSLLALTLLVASVLLTVHYSLRPPASSSSTSQLSLATVCLLCLLLLLVSPLLSTLTWSYSSDTIYLLVALLSVAHLLSFDYGSINNPIAQPSLVSGLIDTTATHQPDSQPYDSPDLSSTSQPATGLSPVHHPVSLNCALLLSLLLASRLSSPLHVSLLLLLSSLLFAVSPSQQQLVCRWSASAHLLSFVALSLLCCYVLSVFGSVLLAVVYVLCVLSVCVVCPWWLLRVQHYKRTIHGPWDYNDEPETSSENL